MPTLREQIWDMIASLIDEDYRESHLLYMGVNRWEKEVQDIVMAIEELASTIETKIVERSEYITSGDAKADDGDRRYHKEAEGD